MKSCEVKRELHKIYVPRVDPAIETAKIHWEKKEGDEIKEGEVLLIAEGEKTTFEVESPAKGILHKKLYPSESDVPVGEVIGIIREPGEKIEEEFEVKEKIKEKVEEKPIEIAETVNKRKISEVIQLTGIRKTIAERLSYSHKTTPTATLILDINMEKMMDFRKILNQKLNKKLSFTAFLAKAIAKALKNHRILNSSLEEDKIKVYEDINISIAIDTPDGQVAPAVFKTDKKSISEISDEIIELTEKAKNKKLELPELVSGTFTITNLGGFGVETVLPIINPPQAAIIGIGKTQMKPIIVEDKIIVKPFATLSLVFDHRIFDRAPAALFLNEVKDLIENPQSLE